MAREEVKRKLLEDAGSQLDPGDHVRTVMLGQTRATPVLYVLIAPILLAPFCRPRAVALGNDTIYVIDQSWLRPKKVKAVRRYPLGGTPVEVTKLSVTVGDEPPIYRFLGQKEPSDEIAAAT